MANNDIEAFKNTLDAMRSLLTTALGKGFGGRMTINIAELRNMAEELNRLQDPAITQANNLLAKEKNIIEEAAEDAENRRSQAESYANETLNKANSEASRIKSEASAFAVQTREQANDYYNTTLAQTQEQAKAVLTDAQVRAQQILQDAQGHAAQLVSQSEIVKEAEKQATMMVENARQRAAAMWTRSREELLNELESVSYAMTQHTEGVKSLYQSIQQASMPNQR